jgi:hypothetical protein
VERGPAAERSGADDGHVRRGAARAAAASRSEFAWRERAEHRQRERCLEGVPA